MLNRLDTQEKHALSVLLESANLPNGIIDAWWENGTTIAASVTDDFVSTDSTGITITITKDSP